MKEFQNLYDTYLFRPANSIMHDPFREFFIKNQMFDKIFQNQQPVDMQSEFLELYPLWISSSKLNLFSGLESLPNRFISLGVTQAIDDFVLYCYKNNLHLKMFKGEYPYAREISSVKWFDEAIDDVPLSTGDAVIISCPFSATGDIHPQWDTLINTCNNLNIPVFVDCAFFGTCKDIQVSFDHACIDTVAFSPTKGLNCGNFRTGIAFTKRQGKDCSLDILTSWHHGIHIHTAMAYELMKNFSPDTIPLVYESVQKLVCDQFGLIPSKTMHLGLGGQGWEHFTRDGVCNRVGLRKAIYDMAHTGKTL
jgi:hypothetical protein